MNEAARILQKRHWVRGPNTQCCLVTGQAFPVSYYRSYRSFIGLFVVAQAYGFEVICFHGLLCGYTSLKFPRYATEDGMEPAFERMMAFLEENYPKGEALPPYLYGD